MTTKLKTPDIDLIELSGKWVYQHPIVDWKLRVNGTIYKVKEGEYNTASGLDYMVVENTQTGELSMVFEGTQGGKDIVTDGTLPGSVPNTQLKAANEAYK
ncbi:hypothetical protein HCI95_16225, partial [Listeria booriae]|nr:hypothetical protein [Listeria booriae]